MGEREISVVIPAFEHRRALEGCLRALSAHTLPSSQFGPRGAACAVLVGLAQAATAAYALVAVPKGCQAAVSA